jgi:hypothetical protein
MQVGQEQGHLRIMEKDSMLEIVVIFNLVYRQMHLVQVAVDLHLDFRQAIEKTVKPADLDSL